MANKKECMVCKKLTQEKYKHFKLWRALAIVFMALAVLFAVLYFANGKVIIDEEYVQENIVGGNGQANNNNQSNVIQLQDNSVMVGLIIAGIAIGGGVIVGCCICKKKDNSKEHY